MPLQVHSSINLLILVCTGMYWYVHGRLGTSRYVVVCASMYWYRTTSQSHIQVCTSPHNHPLVCTGLYWYVLVCSGMYWYVLVCSCIYWYVPVCTIIYPDFQYTISVLPRYSIHGGTWKYMAVPESPVYLNEDGTSRYMAVQSLVP